MEEEWGVACDVYGGGEGWIEGLVGKRKRRWDDNTKMDLQEIGLGGGGAGLDWSGSG